VTTLPLMVATPEIVSAIGLGWRPIVVYLAATVFNTLLALCVAWIMFGVIGL